MGSAVGVSAGFGIVALGINTDDSLVSGGRGEMIQSAPASRANLYSIKPSKSVFPRDDVVPVMHVKERRG